MKMTQEDKNRLKNIPKKIKRCFICHTEKRHRNPMAVCHFCGELFCYDHIRLAFTKKKLIDTCEECYKAHEDTLFW